MRTTLDLKDNLLAAAKRQAATENTTLTAIVERALAALLVTRIRPQRAFRLRMKTEKGRYIGGVDLADRDALFEVMDGRR